MSKHLLILGLLCTVLVSISGTASAQTEWVCPEGFENQTLRLFNWANFVGETTISDFEEACGVTVEYSVFGSNDLLNTMRSQEAHYDIIIPTVDIISVLANEGLLTELDHDKIPNLVGVADIFENFPRDYGFQYSVPYQWATYGLMYDKTVVDEPITSWKDFFNYDGRVAWINEARGMMHLALAQLGLDVNSTDPADVRAAGDYLISGTANEVFAIADGNQDSLLQRGEVDAIMIGSGNAVRLVEACGCDDFVFVFPTDGVTPLFDALAIPANAENPDLAHAFIDYVLDPHVSASISNDLGTGTPVIEALLYIDPDVMNNGISYPTKDVIENVLTMENVVTVGDPLSIEEQQLYSDEWVRVRAELVSQ